MDEPELNELLAQVPGGWLEINTVSGETVAIAVINSEGDEHAVYEGRDLSKEMAQAGDRVAGSKPDGAYSWPVQS